MSSLKTRLNTLENVCSKMLEPDAASLFFWELFREDDPELPERPPDEFIKRTNGTHIIDYLRILEQDS